MPLIHGLDLGDVECPGEASAAACSGSEKDPLAFVVVGDARSFLENATHSAYKRHVLDSFGARSHRQLFLYLKHDRPDDIEAVTAKLRPARAIVVPRSTYETPFAPSICIPPVGRWHDPAYQSRTMRWWGALNATWHMVRAFEEEHSMRFGGIFLSRPDLLFQRDFGPRCLYDPATWYTGGPGGPDWLWLMPRLVAAKALTSASVFANCQMGMKCCEMQHAAYRVGNAHDERHQDDWVFSYWIMRYWTLHFNFTVSTRMRGHAHLIARPPPGAQMPYAHVGCGAPNCGRYAQCLDEWKNSHFGET